MKPVLHGLTLRGMSACSLFMFEGNKGPALSNWCSAGLAWHPHAGAPGQPDTAPILATGSVDMSARLWSAAGVLPTCHLSVNPNWPCTS